MALHFQQLSSLRIDAGLKLKKTRESLGLRYRQVEQASNLIAHKHRNLDYVVGLSRLADIENKGVVPSLHRFYSLCAIYRLDLADVFEWYGIQWEAIWQDFESVAPAKTHLMNFTDGSRGSVALPLQLDPGIDFRKTTYLSRAIQRWGRVPLSLLSNLNIHDYRYGFIGADDYLMYPMLRPGALVQIDERRGRIRNSGWTHEFERPIYFFELRDGYACAWCNLSGDHLILQPHSGSPSQPIVLNYPTDVDVIGQVVGVAMQLGVNDLEARPRGKARSALIPK